jgi:hypothetical protein
LAFLLRRPGVRVAVVTSDHVPEWQVKYLLDLAGAPRAARARLALIGLGDLSARPLADKLLDRADARREISAFVGSAEQAFIAPFSVGLAERDLALALDLPIQGIDHRFAVQGSKTGAIVQSSGLSGVCEAKHASTDPDGDEWYPPSAWPRRARAFPRRNLANRQLRLLIQLSS